MIAAAILIAIMLVACMAMLIIGAKIDEHQLKLMDQWESFNK